MAVVFAAFVFVKIFSQRRLPTLPLQLFNSFSLSQASSSTPLAVPPPPPSVSPPPKMFGDKYLRRRMTTARRSKSFMLFPFVSLALSSFFFNWERTENEQPLQLSVSLTPASFHAIFLIPSDAFQLSFSLKLIL